MQGQQFTLINRLSEIINSSSDAEMQKIILSIIAINKFKRSLDSNHPTKTLYEEIANFLNLRLNINNYKVVIVKPDYENTVYQFGEIKTEHYCFTKKFSEIFTVHIYIDQELNGFEKMTLNSLFEETIHLIYIHLIISNLKQSTTVDSLTHLQNRQSFNQEMKTLIPLAIREKMNIGLLLINIDRFTAVNDEHGNEFGDEFLKLYAQKLKKIIRTSDIAVRFGGGEFLVLLMNVESEEKTLELAHKIKDILAQTYLLSPNGDQFKKTVTIGISMFPNDSLDIEEVIHNAKIALTDAQATSRNMILRYMPEDKSTIDLF